MSTQNSGPHFSCASPGQKALRATRAGHAGRVSKRALADCQTSSGRKRKTFLSPQAKTTSSPNKTTHRAHSSSTVAPEDPEMTGPDGRHLIKAAEGNRTLIQSLGSYCVATTPQPRKTQIDDFSQCIPRNPALQTTSTDCRLLTPFQPEVATSGDTITCNLVQSFGPRRCSPCPTSA